MSETFDIALGLIKRHEGFRSKPYKCTAGKLTIGYGHNLDDVGITQAQAQMLLNDDVGNAAYFLEKNYSWFNALDTNRKAALIDMCFQLGKLGYSKFIRMNQWLYAKNYDDAAIAALQSKWAEQTPERAAEIAKIIRTGNI